MSTQELIKTYGKPAEWTADEWESWNRHLAQHFAIRATIQHVEQLRAYGGNGPVIAVIKHEGKRYKGILFEMEDEG